MNNECCEASCDCMKSLSTEHMYVGRCWAVELAVASLVVFPLSLLLFSSPRPWRHNGRGARGEKVGQMNPGSQTAMALLQRASSHWQCTHYSLNVHSRYLAVVCLEWMVAVQFAHCPLPSAPQAPLSIPHPGQQQHGLEVGRDACVALYVSWARPGQWVTVRLLGSSQPAGSVSSQNSFKHNTWSVFIFMLCCMDFW